MTTTPPLFIRVKVQHALALGYLDGDDGDFVWAMCRKGLSKALGQKLIGDTKILVKVTLELVDEEAERLNHQAAGEPQNTKE